MNSKRVRELLLVALNSVEDASEIPEATYDEFLAEVEEIEHFQEEVIDLE